jgi:hypothetical protein
MTPEIIVLSFKGIIIAIFIIVGCNLSFGAVPTINDNVPINVTIAICTNRIVGIICLSTAAILGFI